MLPKDNLVTAKTHKKEMVIAADKAAVGKSYRLQVRARSKIQRRQRQNRRDVWVTVEEKVVTHDFKLVVDYSHWPKLTMPADHTCVLPPTQSAQTQSIQIQDARSSKSRKVPCLTTNGKLSLVGKGSGLAMITVKYEIDSVPIEREFKVRVNKKCDPITTNIAVGSDVDLDLKGVMKKFKLRTANIVGLSYAENPPKMQLEPSGKLSGLLGGEANATLLVEGILDRRTATESELFAVPLNATVSNMSGQ